MCTAILYKTKDAYFGRTLDYEISYGEQVVITPRNYRFSFSHQREILQHYAIIGVATVANGYPLYYDAVNEKGLAIAGLNFVGNAVYRKPDDEKNNVASFELLPWILSQCASVKEACNLLKCINITDTAFDETLPPAELHWMISDRTESITLESRKDGLHVFPNPVEVLTNNPPFEMQLFGLNNYRHLSASSNPDTFSPHLRLPEYCRGLAAFGLPGDFSSPSRFVRTAFVKENAVSGEDEVESINQFFHILGAVGQSRGCCVLKNGRYVITQYTGCCNIDRGIYYYTTYRNHQISAVELHRENLDSQTLICYPMITTEQIAYLNDNFR